MFKWFAVKPRVGARCVALALPACLVALFASPALATTTIGQTGPPSVFSASAGQEGINVGAVVPAAGTVTSFQTQSRLGAVPGVYDFQVLRPEGINQYLVVGDTGNHTDPADGSLVTIPVNIPVQAGDVLGVYVVSLWAGLLNPFPGGSITSNFQAQPSPGQTISMQGASTTPTGLAAAIDESATIGPVQVTGAAQQLSDLRNAVTGVGTGTSLTDKVASAQSYLTANDTTDACGTMSAFINQLKAQSGKKISASTAATLSSAAQQIQAALGC